MKEESLLYVSRFAEWAPKMMPSEDLRRMSTVKLQSASAVAEKRVSSSINDSNYDLR